MHRFLSLGLVFFFALAASADDVSILRRQFVDYYSAGPGEQEVALNTFEPPLMNCTAMNG